MRKKLRRLDAEVKRLGLRGDKKHEFLCDDLGWVADTSPKQVRGKEPPLKTP